ncbi:MAG: hypothetical protein LKJ17_09200 [Oscillospiraceae bacterium]|jgi:hypothetical protein|nr:hypothetical protein [Oscillospiraceae bacterium]
MGSAYGGQWKPAKSEDERFLGEPGEIKTSYDKKGNRIDTKIGEDGRATRERHYTDHNKPWAHTNPHDHNINWDSPKPGIPNFEKPHINYPDGNVPEFKYFKEAGYMSMVGTNSFEESRFKTISDFKNCMSRNGEVEFEWNGKNYSITHPDKISISEANKHDTEKLCNTADEVLEYRVGDDRLRDVITQVTVWSRTI